MHWIHKHLFEAGISNCALSPSTVEGRVSEEMCAGFAHLKCDWEGWADSVAPARGDWTGELLPAEESPAIHNLNTAPNVATQRPLLSSYKIILSKLVITAYMLRWSYSMYKAGFSWYICISCSLSTLFQFASQIRAPFSLFPAVRFSFKSTVTH